MQKIKQLAYAGFLILIASCGNKVSDVGEVEGFIPVYASSLQLNDIRSTPPVPIVNGGKIATKANYLYQVETSQGIHVFNISNPAQPVRIAFIKIPFCEELTIKDNYLFSNNFRDLVVLNIADPQNVTVTQRVANAFPESKNNFPPEPGYFVCADPSKGPVASWVKQTINNPRCSR